MYKKQMIFQRIVCYAMLIAAALVFVYSLGLMTDLYDALYTTIRSPSNLDRTTVTGSRLYYDMQGFNGQFTNISVILILVTLFLFVTNTHSRRKYYIGNFVAVGLSAVCNIGVSVWTLGQLAVYKEQFLQIDFEALKTHSETMNTLYTDSTFWFDVSYGVFGLLLLLTVLLVVNLILKLIVMKEEKRLIGSRKDVRA
ncbi:MAG: hypothetical protein NC299_06180 [Lachnospiraceae bacterium]|nr:hypothetical protein [Ruminococcus sp.]MCM1274941.1 hypothetical protein [Lachnospiraceae bacterium]